MDKVSTALLIYSIQLFYDSGGKDRVKPTTFDEKLVTFTKKYNLHRCFSLR